MRILLLTLALLLPVAAHAQPQQQRAIKSEDFTQTRPDSGKGTRKESHTYRPASKPLKRPINKFSASTLKVGVTLWKVERGTSTKEIARRVETDTKFREGELLRLSIESPRPGYLYVIDRDWFNDDTAGKTNLIFPRRDDDNRLEPGKLITIPAESKTPFKTSPAPNQVGEMLTIIVTDSPLSLPLSDDVLPISDAQLAEWKRRWSGSTERFEMIGGAGQVRSMEEEVASEGSRQLTRDDPPPQTIYFLTPKSSAGLLFNLMLSYVK